MKKQEAMNWIGREVEFPTYESGICAGILEEVTDDSPWKGIIRVIGYIEAPSVLRNAYYKPSDRLLRIGEKVKIGAVNIHPLQRQYTIDVEKLLIEKITAYEERAKQDPGYESLYLRAIDRLRNYLQK